MLFLVNPVAVAQVPADSVVVTFRYHSSSGTTVYVPGEFNGWGPNAGGVISPGAVSQMSFDAGIGAWIKTYRFKIHDSGRTLGDSVYQYKFNVGGSTWNSDPLNPETNAADNSNSVLRLNRRFWFEFYGLDSSQTFIRIAAGLCYSNADTITSVLYETGPNPTDSLTVVDVTSSLDVSKRTLSFTPVTPIPKDDYLRLVAFTSAGDSVVYERIAYKPTLAQLPAYAQMGVTLPNPGLGRDSTTFRLQVTQKSVVLLRIAPAGTSLSTVTPVVLHRNYSSDDWWRNLDLPPGTYEYVYEFEDGKRIYDPWGRQDGVEGTRFTVGPEGLTADNYVWHTTGWVRPPLNRLVIYELNVREAVAQSAGQGGFKELISRLAHFNDLGVNAIELMPVTDYGNVGPSNYFSWGYDVNQHFALEPSYGTPAEFKELVDSAHARGIAVIMDVVFNHMTDAAPLWQMLPDESYNPYFKSATDLKPNEDALTFFRDMNHWTSYTQEYIHTVLKMWIDDYRIDGFRYDFTQGIGWDAVASDSALGIQGWSNRIKNEYGDSVYQIAEHLPESPALLMYTGLNSEWHDSFHDEIFKDLIPSQKPPFEDFSSLVLGLGAYPGNDVPATPSSYWSRTQPVNATVTHDEQSLIYEMLNFQGVTDTVEAIWRDKVYGTMMLASLGIPMLWQGMEYGESRGWKSDNEKLSYRPVQWNRASTDLGRYHFQWYKALIYQRRYNPALYNGTMSILVRDDPKRTIVWGFSDSVSSSQVVLAANCSSVADTIHNIQWLSTGVWHDVIDKTDLNVSSLPLPELIVRPYHAIIYTNMSDSELNIPVYVEQPKNAVVPEEYTLFQNYPNPFNPSTTIRFALPERAQVSLVIYDVLGRSVASLIQGARNRGTYNVTWDGRSGGRPVSSGMYVAVLRINNRTLSRKLLLVK